ncbi:Lrp/AsnC family transcriptional regulator [Geodermatophilus sp. DSM 44513]|uniref:Lrp/AsnC family transcriptional regulator n=1 Tax=Geodermatophilus sp. DSM 44513 TaxID=1528104 RepID=UPI001287608A|nr:Lrp/AsnC family transcriptional regulator [Geodermatophilus sp. DSM 44513]WNV77136.1 Lrp/AsnC family transcriptional regulator [Geodermatophilus sp. DSM 44513]
MDETDRTLIGLLQQDATRSYADLGRAVHLSTAATHERVRKMRQAGVIRRTTVEVDPVALGAVLLAFVEIDTEGWVKKPLVDAVRDDPRVEDLHSIAGDTHFLAKVRVTGPADLEDLLHALYRVPGVRNTRTHVALQTYVERPPSPGPPPAR